MLLPPSTPEAFVLLLLAPAAFLAACAPAAPDDSTVLADAFDEASETYGVPAALLASTAWSVSRFDTRDGHRSSIGTVGLMDLRTDDRFPSLARGATIVGASVEDVAQDPRLSVLAAAAVLAESARGRQAQTGEPVDTMEEWYPVFAAYSGATDPLVADGFAGQVFDFAEWGFVAESPEGEVVVVAPTPMAWRKGPDLVGSGLIAQFVPASTANYTDDNRGAGDIDMVVIHDMEGSYSGSISWFQNSAAQASAHYAVRSSDGEITQMVDEADVAWHAGHWDTNSHSIGIEHEGYASDPDRWYTEAMYQASAALTRDICDRYGIPKDRDHIIGHYEVPGCSYGSGGGSSCHTDPGDGWDWDHYIALVNGSGGSSSSGSSGLPDGTRTGSFSGSLYAERYGEGDTCSGPVSAVVNTGRLYASATCTLVKHADKSGDKPVVWSGTVSGSSVSGNLVVDGYSAPFSGTVNGDGTINIQMSGSKDIGGDVGVLDYDVDVNIGAL